MADQTILDQTIFSTEDPALSWLLVEIESATTPRRVKMSTLNVQGGSGSPEGVKTGNRGDLYRQTDGTPSACVWAKTKNDGGLTGWMPINQLQILDARRYGDTEGGSSDSTATIQAAINAAGAVGYIYLAGTHKIDGQLSVGSGNVVTFFGPGSLTDGGSGIWNPSMLGKYAIANFCTGQIVLPNLPTTNPTEDNRVWNYNGLLVVKDYVPNRFPFTASSGEASTRQKDIGITPVDNTRVIVYVLGAGHYFGSSISFTGSVLSWATDVPIVTGSEVLVDF